MPRELAGADRPRFTIAIGTFKRARELERAVASALAQSGDDYEVLIGDDASPDDTPAVVRRLAADSRVRHYRNPTNLGLQANVQKVCREARGEYLFILTDDDEMLPGALERLRGVIDRQPEVAYILSPLYSVDEASGEVRHVHRTFDADQRAEAGLAAMWRMCGSAWVLSRQVLKAEAVDWAAWAAHGDNIFFPIIVAGRLLLQHPSYYVAEPLVRHTFFNRVHWERFGRNQLEIELALAADRSACMRAILADTPPSAETRRLTEAWEVGNLQSYLRQHPAGFDDLERAAGRAEADRLLEAKFGLTPAQRRALAAWRWHRPALRLAWAVKDALRRLAPGLVLRLRALRGGWAGAGSTRGVDG